jgi:TatD DNase family protein
MPSIDFHTHQFKSESFIQILNIFSQDLPIPENEIFYSTGLHPWHLGIVNAEESMSLIEHTAVQKNMLVVGECGLDRSIATDFTTQEYYFRKQIGIAERHSKPLVIHCVRAFPELMKLKKETRSLVPWIIHGFQGNRQTALQLISHHFYFSVGEPLLTNDRKKEILAYLPLDRLFLETDDSITPISKIYALASEILNIDKEALDNIILQNFKHLFGDKNVVNNYLTSN